MRSVALGRLRFAVLSLVLAAIAPWSAPVQARASSAPSILRDLARERAAAGLPHALTLDTPRSTGCKLHDAWMARNHKLAGNEPVGSPGYTAAGASAARDALLAAGTSWRHGDPWRNAPLQHALLLQPGLSAIGAAEAHGYSCITVTPGLTTPVVTHDTVWTTPTDGQRVPFAERARERPLLPQTTVGIARGRRTGPYIDVFAQSPLAPPYPPAPIPLGFDSSGQPIWGPDKAAYDQEVATILAFPLPLSRITHATLEDPKGRPVAVRVIDSAQLGGQLGAGDGFVLPVHPLHPSTRYRASVTLATTKDVPAGEARTLTYRWQFKTSDESLSSG
jgi:hypothetical protein